jgi:hypothetical protein
MCISSDQSLKSVSCVCKISKCTFGVCKYSSLWHTISVVLSTCIWSSLSGVRHTKKMEIKFISSCRLLLLNVGMTTKLDL